MIEFQDKKFKTRGINLADYGEVLISTTSLSDSLLDDKYEYVSKEAQFVDEQIFFFVDENLQNHPFLDKSDRSS